MNILVTGATGFLGSRTVEYLAERKEVNRILATGRNPKSILIYRHPKVEYQFGDLSDKDFVESLFQVSIDYVINCAGLSSPWGTYEMFYESNVKSLQNLILVSRDHGIKRFIFISSPSIYFDYKDHFNLREENPIPNFPSQANNYSYTKLLGERLLKHSGLEYITLRPRALIGRGDRVIMPRIIRAHQAGRLRIMGDGENIADLTPVANMVEVIWQSIVSLKSCCNEAYNISNGNPVKLWAFINQMFHYLQLQPLTHKVPYKILMTMASFMEWKAHRMNNDKEPALTKYLIAVLARNFYFDITKPQKYLGFKPRQSIDEALVEFVSWYKKEGSYLT